MTAAAFGGRTEILRRLLAADADVNSPHGWALQAAASEGHADIVEALLNSGADVDALTRRENFPQETALQRATENGRLDIVRLLLDRGANPSLHGGEEAPPVLAAAVYAEEDILARLIKANANVNAFRGCDRSTPLINAARFISGTRSLERLIKAGALVDATDKDGKTALIAAAEVGDTEVVRFLLEQGADVMHTTKSGKNALKTALESGVMDCVEVLVDHVSNIMSALRVAMNSGNKEVASVIRASSPTTSTPRYEIDTQEKEVVQTENHPDANNPIVDNGATVSGDQSKVNGPPSQGNTTDTAPYQPPANAETDWRESTTWPSGFFDNQYSNGVSLDRFSRSAPPTPRPPPTPRFRPSRSYTAEPGSYEGNAEIPAVPPLPQPIYYEYFNKALPAEPSQVGDVGDYGQVAPMIKRPATVDPVSSRPASSAITADPIRRALTPSTKLYKAYRPGVYTSAENNISLRGRRSQTLPISQPSQTSQTAQTSQTWQNSQTWQTSQTSQAPRASQALRASQAPQTSYTQVPYSYGGLTPAAASTYGLISSTPVPLYLNNRLPKTKNRESQGQEPSTPAQQQQNQQTSTPSRDQWTRPSNLPYQEGSSYNGYSNTARVPRLSQRTFTFYNATGSRYQQPQGYATTLRSQTLYNQRASQQQYYSTYDANGAPQIGSWGKRHVRSKTGIM